MLIVAAENARSSAFETETAPMFKCLRLIIIGVLLLSCRCTDLVAADIRLVDSTLENYRVPVDVVWWQGRVVVGNSRSGTLSVLSSTEEPDDLDAHCVRCQSHFVKVESEWALAESIGGLAVVGGRLLVLDDQANQVIVVESSESIVSPPAQRELCVVGSLDVPSKPVEICVSPNGRMVAVASLWAHAITLAEVGIANGSQNIRDTGRIELPFAPRKMLFLNDDRLVVTDAYGGTLFVLDIASRKVVHRREINGHNIRGLSLNADKSLLMVSHQTLDSDAYTSYEQVFWGVVMRNGLQSIPVRLLDEKQLDERMREPIEEPERTAIKRKDVYAGYHDVGESSRSPMRRSDIGGASFDHANIYPLGTPSVGSGDPSKILISNDDTALVLLSGVDQVAWRRASHLPFARLKTGRRPEAACFNPDQTISYIVNRFDDSVTVISLSGQQPTVVQTLSLGAMRSLTAAERGEQLFFDASLSLDGWFSCHSCHTDGHTNGLRSDTLGDEGQGAPKKVLSLLGARDSGPWAWNGGKPSLEKQIQTSLIVSMQSQMEIDDKVVSLLAEFVRTLPPPPGITAARGGKIDGKLLNQGRRLFDTVGCISCHSGKAFTSEATYDVGIHDELGNQQFNPPSLRGISQRASFFHDGRAKTLRDVLKSGHHGADQQLAEEELNAIEVLLLTL